MIMATHPSVSIWILLISSESYSSEHSSNAPTDIKKTKIVKKILLIHCVMDFHQNNRTHTHTLYGSNVAKTTDNLIVGLPQIYNIEIGLNMISKEPDTACCTNETIQCNTSISQHPY